jgi:hypothetical protein
MIDLSHLQIELREVYRLLPYARNSRTHSAEQVAQVAASIKEFGWTSPILVDGEGTIIAGHARLLAARQLGMPQVPVIVLSHLTPAQRRALVIADNKLALNAGWDTEVLRAEMAALEGDDVSIAVRDPDVRKTIELYAAASGQKMPLSATTPHGAGRLSWNKAAVSTRRQPTCSGIRTSTRATCPPPAASPLGSIQAPCRSR